MITCNIFIYQIDTSNNDDMKIFNNFLSKLKQIDDDIEKDIDNFNITIECEVDSLTEINKIIKILNNCQKSFKKKYSDACVGIDLRF